MPNPTTVLVVDDSAFMRKMITEVLSGDPELRVVGQARDGADALKKMTELRPDVVTLDVEMPVMDGYEALSQIMRQQPTPVVMLSSLTQAGAEATIRCLQLGAVDFVSKPSGAISLDIARIGADIVAKVKVAAKARIKSAGAAAPPRPVIVPAPAGPPARPNGSPATARTAKLLVIGSSTGGPRALQTLIPALPVELGVPIVIVQHMPAGFTTSLARRLNDESPYTVREAADGDTLQAGCALVAPGGRHLQFDARGVARLTDEPPVHGVRPSIDVTLASLTRLHAGRMVAVLLTGMGQDGARGLKALRDQGGVTLAEDESTCVVYGMPKAAHELGAVCHLLPLGQLAAAAAQAVRAGA